MVFPDVMHQFTAGPQQVEIARKGGQAKSPNKSLAAKLRELKKKGIGDETVEWLHNAMTSDELSLYQALVLVRSMASKAQTLKEQEMVTRLMLDFHKIRHGTKETKHSVDVTTKEFKFIISAEVNNNEVKPSSLEADKETTGSVQLLTGPINN